MIVGGNTPCVEIRSQSDDLLILDAGSGLRNLGQDVMDKSKGNPIRADILLSHTHWDHIQGFPFFSPAYVPGNHISIHGKAENPEELRELFSGQMQNIYFPVAFENLQAHITFTSLTSQQSIALGKSNGLKISALSIPHPGGALAYRIEENGNSVCYVTDIEHYPDNLDQDVITFVSGADVLIHDAMYSPDDCTNGRYKGYGHSTWKSAVQTAIKAQVKQLMLFHFSPQNRDTELMRVEQEVRKFFSNSSLAKEGLELILTE